MPETLREKYRRLAREQDSKQDLREKYRALAGKQRVAIPWKSPPLYQPPDPLASMAATDTQRIAYDADTAAAWQKNAVAREMEAERAARVEGVRRAMEQKKRSEDVMRLMGRKSGPSLFEQAAFGMHFKGKPTDVTAKEAEAVLGPAPPTVPQPPGAMHRRLGQLQTASKLRNIVGEPFSQAGAYLMGGKVVGVQTKGLIPTLFTPFTEISRGVKQAVESSPVAERYTPPVLREYSGDALLLLGGGAPGRVIARTGMATEELIARTILGNKTAAQALKDAVRALPRGMREKTWKGIAKLLSVEPESEVGRALFRTLPEYEAVTPSALRAAWAEAADIRTPAQARGFVERMSKTGRMLKLEPEAPTLLSVVEEAFEARPAVAGASEPISEVVARARKGATQEEIDAAIAERSGVSPETIRHVRAGERGLSPWEKERIARSKQKGEEIWTPSQMKDLQRRLDVKADKAIENIYREAAEETARTLTSPTRPKLGQKVDWTDTSKYPLRYAGERPVGPVVKKGAMPEVAAPKVGEAAYAPAREPLPSEVRAAAEAPSVEEFIAQRGGNVEAIRRSISGREAVLEEFRKAHPGADEAFAVGRYPGEALEYERTIPQRKKIPEKEIVKAQDVARAMERFLGTRLNVKLRGVQRLGNRFFAASGQFARRQFAGSIRKINDVDTMLHEFGHGLEIKLFGYEQSRLPEAIRNATQSVRSDLVDLGQDLYGGLVPMAPEEFFAREGFAEFIWQWMGKPDEVQARAPNVYQWFNEVLQQNPKWSKKLTEIQRLVTRFRSQDPEMRTLATFAKPGESGLEFDPVLSAFQRRFGRFVEAIQDEAYFLKKAQQQILGKDVTTGPWDWFGAMRGTTQGSAMRSLRDVQIDLDGNYLGPGFMQIMRPVFKEGHYPNFVAYHKAKHAYQSMTRVGKKGESLARATGDQLADVKAIIDQYEGNADYLHIIRAQKQMTEFLNNELYIQLSEMGMLEQYHRMVEANPYYMPLNRLLENVTGKAAAAGKGSLARRRGGTQLVKEYSDAVSDYVFARRQGAMWGRLRRKLVGMRQKPMAGPWIEGPLDIGKVPEHVKLKSIERELKKAGADLSQADMDAVLEIWKEPFRLPQGDTIMAVPHGDGFQYYRLHSELYREMQKWTEGDMGFLLNVSNKITKIRRLGITGVNPAFAIANFFARDMFTSFMVDPMGRGVGFFPLHVLRNLKGLARGSRKAFADLFPSIAQSKIGNKLFRDQVAEVYRGLGADLSEWIARDKNIRKIASFRTDPNIFTDLGNIVRHPVEAMRTILGPGESGARIAQVERVMREMDLMRPGAVIPEDVSLLIRQAAGEVSTNFRRMGTLGRKLNRISLFFNARIQGVYLTGKTFAKHPVRTMARGLTWITGPTLGLWYENRDKDWYQNLPAWRRLGAWNINLGSDEDPWIFSIPIPFEFGVIFKAFPEAVINSLYRHDKESFRANEDLEGLIAEARRQIVPFNFELGDLETMGWSLASNVSALGPAIDVVANKRWPNRPLVPERLARGSESLQSASYTSATAKFLGKYMTMGAKSIKLKHLIGADEEIEFSPIHIDHLIHGYSGGALTDLITFVESLAGHPLKDEALIEAADNWVYGRFFPRTLSQYADINWMYDEYGRLSALDVDYKIRMRDKEEGWQEYKLTPQQYRELAILRAATQQFKAMYDRYESSKTPQEAGAMRRKLGAHAVRTRERIERMRR